MNLVVLVILAGCFTANVHASEMQVDWGGEMRLPAGNNGQERDARSDGELRPDMTSPRVWTFGIGRDRSPLEKIDMENMQVVGLGVDLVDAACRMTQQHCEFVFYKNYTDCWHWEHGFSPALAHDWFDGCVNFYPTSERRLVNAFSRSYTHPAPSALYVRTGDSLSAEDLMQNNEIAIGFIEGGWLTADCLVRHGVMVNDQRAQLYTNRRDVMQALGRGEIRVAFVERHNADEMDFQTIDAGDLELQCASRGVAVMTRKDNHELLQWLNPAIERVMRSYDYGRMCYVWAHILGEPTYCLGMSMAGVSQGGGDGVDMGNGNNDEHGTEGDTEGRGSARRVAVENVTTTSTVSVVGILGIVVAAVVLILIVFGILLLIGRNRRRPEVAPKSDDVMSVASQNSSSVSSVMFRRGTVRTDFPPDTISNPTPNSTLRLARNEQCVAIDTVVT